MTTTTQPSSPPKAEPITEPDQLGPLARPAAPAPTVTSFADGTAVRGLILSALGDAVEPARTARGRVAATPAAAVHEVRKALRRTRALLELIGGALPRRERKDIRAALVAARRSLGPARDLAVASEALMKQATGPEVAPAAAAIVAAARADAASSQSVADDVGRAIDVAVAQHDAIVAALPDEVAARTLVRALAETYRRARQARRKAKRSDRAAHRWRRRSKELSYQLALFGDVPAAAGLRESLGELDDQLDKVVDRLMLGDFVGLYGHAAEAEAVGALLTQVHDELLDRRDAAYKESKALFKLRPRKLRKRLRRAIAPPRPAEAEADPEETSEGNGTPIASA